MPSPEIELHYDSPFHLLLAVILSAQCTDKRVNMVTTPLFDAYPDPQSLAMATEEEVFPYIKSVTFPNNKTRHLIRAAKVLTEDFGGEMPSDIDNLMKLPGVGRKTANVMLAVVWDKAAMAVDTHVFRGQQPHRAHKKFQDSARHREDAHEASSGRGGVESASLAHSSWPLCVQSQKAGMRELRHCKVVSHACRIPPQLASAISPAKLSEAS